MGPGSPRQAETGILLYYKYVPLNEQEQEHVARFYEDLCQGLGLTGRIRVARDGVNVTVGGAMPDLRAHAAAVAAHPLLDGADIDFKLAASSGSRNDATRRETKMDTLVVRRCEELVTLGPLARNRANPRANTAVHLTPQQFHAMLARAAAAAAAAAEGGAPPQRAAAGSGAPQPQQAEAAAAATAAAAVSAQGAQAADEGGGGGVTSGVTTAGDGKGGDGDGGGVVGGRGASLCDAGGSADESLGPVVLLDARNVYETRIGHFDAGPSVPTLDPRTRAFSELPAWMDAHEGELRNRTVLMYCTGGVRCERASAYLREKGPGFGRVFQLSGGIQRYLEAFPDGGFFRGKNFMYDDRIAVGPAAPPNEPGGCGGDGEDFATAPTDLGSGGGGVVGRCLLCGCAWDDYGERLRCSRCRLLVLVCDACRAARGRVPAHGRAEAEAAPAQAGPARGADGRGSGLTGHLDGGCAPCMVPSAEPGGEEREAGEQEGDEEGGEAGVRPLPPAPSPGRLPGPPLLCELCRGGGGGGPGVGEGCRALSDGADAGGTPGSCPAAAGPLPAAAAAAAAPCGSVAGATGPATSAAKAPEAQDPMHATGVSGSGAGGQPGSVGASPRSLALGRGKARAGAVAAAGAQAGHEGSIPGAAAAAQPPQRLRILCLHGFRQTGKQFQGRTCALRKKLRDLADFVFVDAPHQLPLFVKEGPRPAVADGAVANAGIGVDGNDDGARGLDAVSGDAGGGGGGGGGPAHEAASHQCGRPALDTLPPSRDWEGVEGCGGAEGDADLEAGPAPPAARKARSAAAAAAKRAWLLPPELYGGRNLEACAVAGALTSPPPPPLTCASAPSYVDELQYTRQTAGWRESLAALVAAVAELGPFDGVFGFSQGASVAAALCALQQQQQQQQQQQLQPRTDTATAAAAAPAATAAPGHGAQQQQGSCDFGFRFAVLASGFPPPAPELVSLMERVGPLELPSLHVYGSGGGGAAAAAAAASAAAPVAAGTADRQIPRAQSEALAAAFAAEGRDDGGGGGGWRRRCLVHQCGHLIPATRPHAEAFRGFLLERIAALALAGGE